MFKYFCLIAAAYAAVIGIDFGSELFKISIIRPGKRLIIVENEQSKRSTPSALSFVEQGREYGYNALREQAKRPESTITFSHNLFASPSTDYFLRTFQPLDFNTNTERGTVTVTIKNNVLEIEEIISMILEHIKDMSEKFGETTVKDCTITVPVFWTKAQRISLINAAQAVGLNVLSLIHENVAAAFYYGIDRFDNETDHYALFYNLGSSYLQVSLVKYNTVVTKVSYSNKQIENVVVLAHAYDETLGGSLFDSLLAEYLALKFEEVSKTSVKSVPKAMTRLLTQANIAKKILSANKSTLVIVNNLYKNIDFKYTLTREELENLILPYEERLVKPILKVLEDSGIDKSLVNYLEIIGGGSRIPKVQEIIKEKTGLDISTHLNGDEAMAHGAALYAANFSSTVHVKPIWLSDLSDKIVSAKVYELVSDNLIHEEVIFDTKQRLGAYKELRLATKSNLYIVIEDSTNSTSIVLGKYEINDIASVNVTDYNLSLIFVLDYNAIPFLHKAAAEYEVTLKQLLKKPNFNLLNNSDNSAKINETQLEANTTIEEVWNTQVKSIKLNHQYIDITHPKLPTGENIKTLINNLSNYKQIEKKIKKVAEAKNELESYVYFLSDKSEEEVYASVTSQSERDSLSELLTSVKTWMESSEFSNSDLKDLRDKKSELESFVNSSLVREYELGVRDSSVEKGKNTLDRLESELLLVNQSKPWIPSREFVAAWSKINETREWISNKTYDQGLLELWQDLAFTSKQLEAKVSYAEHLVEKLKRMARPPRRPYASGFDDGFDWKKFSKEYAKNSKKNNTQDEPQGEQKAEEDVEDVEEIEETENNQDDENIENIDEPKIDL